jgi:glycosyltransferase involved in cell wall biosynthesis
MTILFVVPYAPTNVRTRARNFIAALASGGHEVTVATLWSTAEERAAVDRLSDQVARVLSRQLSAGRAVWNCTRALGTRDPLQSHYSWSPGLARCLLREMERTRFDVVHVEHLRGARYARLLADHQPRNGSSAVPVIWDSVDCITTLFRYTARHSASRRARLAAKLEAPRTADYEAGMVMRFERVLVTAEADRRELEGLAEAWCRRHGRPALEPGRVVVVPNCLDLEHFSPGHESREPLTLVITGKMSYHANVTAVSHLVREIMPQVWAQLPDVRLWVIGKDPAPEILKLGTYCPNPLEYAGSNGTSRSKVLISGGVEDMRPFLRRATLAVAPIQYGAGIQNKVLEAFACGTPVVATPQAVSALDVKSGSHLLVAATPRDSAEAIVSLLKDPSSRARLAETARTHVVSGYDRTWLAARLAGVYEDARAH